MKKAAYLLGIKSSLPFRIKKQLTFYEKAVYRLLKDALYL